MFSPTVTTAFMESFFGRQPEPALYKERIAQAGKALAEADTVVIGAGAGLSDAAGLKFAGKKFRTEFADFISRYGFTDLYTSSFHKFGSEEERWAYWARHIDFARFTPPALPLYKALLSLVEGKDYFVVTTNVDGQFAKSGFEAGRIFEVQGDYAYLQCARACSDTLVYNEELVKEMVSRTVECRIPSSLVPRCPCGAAMEPNLRKDGYFVEDERWHRQAGRYERFIENAARGRCVLLELGVGFNTPSIIRFPFERMAACHPRWTLVRLNRAFPQRQMRGRGSFVGFTEDINLIVKDLSNN